MKTACAFQASLAWDRGVSLRLSGALHPAGSGTAGEGPAGPAGTLLRGGVNLSDFNNLTSMQSRARGLVPCLTSADDTVMPPPVS